MTNANFGYPILRKEDPAILRGEVRYISDMSATGMLFAKVVRSSLAHAKILSVDKSAALDLDGVFAVYIAEDLGRSQRHLASFGQFPPPLLEKWNPKIRPAPVTTLADRIVRYVGEPIALVVAEDQYIAEDAAELVSIEYEPLTSISNTVQALSQESPSIHKLEDSINVISSEPWRSWCSSKEQWNEKGEYQVKWGHNTAIDMSVKVGDVNKEFTNAKIIVKDQYSSHRYTGVPLEGRGILAIPDPDGEGIMVWSSHQIPFFHRALISESIGIPEENIRVSQPYLGGGFGQKAGIYGEDVLIPFAALKLNRPVKWLEDKIEHFQASSHSREQTFDAEMAFDSNGKILGLRYEVLIDTGAHLTFPVVLPYLGMCHIFGPYRIACMEARIRSVFTNKATAAPYRGAGRPEVAFMVNRLIDHGAKNWVLIL